MSKRVSAHNRDAYNEIDTIENIAYLKFLVKYFGEDLADEIHSEDGDYPSANEVNRIICYALDAASKEWQETNNINKK